ncbi:CHAT domain-containing protein [Candidatus Marithrix sp. Canyon 246]|uniref:CHAT domain-containing protein n=1 Tax=Candidatus Marithrix sp. Canyon 246 TaxID=1827136 RepID=UPI000849F662|nr:CHAT domain-containing protein [Candidatus Marithrix sp. Canyon 246]
MKINIYLLLLCLSSVVLANTNTEIQSLLKKSDDYLAKRQDLKAREYADKITKLSTNVNIPTILDASILNNLGNILTVEAYYATAIKKYNKALKLAAKNHILAGRILINMAYANYYNQNFKDAIKNLYAAQQQFKLKSSNTYAKAFGFIGVGKLALELNDTKLAYQSLILAKNLGNSTLMSYSYGFLGRLYEIKQRYVEALSLTRRAIFMEQSPEILFRWQWQLGRIFNRLGKTHEAIKVYKQAEHSLQKIRKPLMIGYRNTIKSFRERIGIIYFELADLLLRQKRFREAIDVIEDFKSVELEDYFDSYCSFVTQENLLDLDMDSNVGIIYPIILSNRIEILLITSDNNIQSFVIPVTAIELKDKVNDFRLELETKNQGDYLNYAQILYRWLIVPLSNQIANLDTLIVVPDGVLRTIPFAALHDGKQFLISKYAIVTMPNLMITNSKFQSKNNNIFLAGLSEAVQNFPALSSVSREVKAINRLYKNVTLLLNRQFTVKNFSSALKTNSYSIIHIAAHGQFKSQPDQTFLVAYDNKIQLNQLEALIKLNKRRQQPLELLTLSACQTAVGDDQAALGLAGVAIKAGARSALASLWLIDDEATTTLMIKFYQQLQKLPKAKALQAAQLSLLHGKYKHPLYWAPFLMIGAFD